MELQGDCNILPSLIPDNIVLRLVLIDSIQHNILLAFLIGFFQECHCEQEWPSLIESHSRCTIEAPLILNWSVIAFTLVSLLVDIKISLKFFVPRTGKERICVQGLDIKS